MSILIPAFNAEKWIEQAVESALNQTWPGIEVIVLNDGSTDGTAEILSRYEDRISVISQPNKGGDVARQKLLEAANGVWAQYLDADDYLLENKIENQMLVAQSSPEADIVMSAVSIEYWKSGAIIYFDKRDLPESPDWFTEFLRWHLPQTGGPLWSVRALNAYGGWKKGQKVCQDYELYSRALRQGATIVSCKRARAVYRIWDTETVCHADPARTSLERLRLTEEMYAYLTDKQMLDAERTYAFNASRFELARALWPYEPERTAQIIKEIRQTDIRFLPEASKTYRFLFRVFGFELAQKVATVVSNLQRLRTLLLPAGVRRGW